MDIRLHHYFRIFTQNERDKKKKNNELLNDERTIYGYNEMEID